MKTARMTLVLLLAVAMMCSSFAITEDYDPMMDVLDAIGVDEYKTTYQYLSQGNRIAYNERIPAVYGLEKVLQAYGKSVTVDGRTGSATIKAMKEVFAALGMPQNDYIDADSFSRLVMSLFCIAEIDYDEDTPYMLIVDNVMDEDEFYAMRAAALYAAGKYYRAWNDYMYIEDYEKADTCEQKWPKNGEVYRNSAYSGKKTTLIIKIDSQESGYATYVKIYAENGDFVSGAFISGASSATVNIPGNTYIIKTGVGTSWFGVNDAFGDEGEYTTLLFEDDEQQVTLVSGYQYTLTINTSYSDPEADGVGSDYTDYSEF